MNSKINLPVNMSVDQMLELLKKSNGSVSFTVKLNSGSPQPDNFDMDFDGDRASGDVDETLYTQTDTSSLLEDTNEPPSWWKSLGDGKNKKVKHKRTYKKKIKNTDRFRKNVLSIMPYTGSDRKSTRLNSSH